MADRVCEHCGDSLEGRRITARFCGAVCRSAAWKARRGYRDPRSVRNGRQRPPGPRQPTPYVVFPVEVLKQAVGTVAAHDAEAAVRQVLDGGGVAIPERSLKVRT